MRYTKIMLLALLIMALVSFVGTSISTASSNDDNYLSQNDSVYSPSGYMNKNIQQARTLTDKYLTNKDKTDAKEGTMQRDVSRKAETQTQLDKPKPQLKQKQSSKGGNAKAQVVASSDVNVAANSKDTPIYIRNSVQEYITRVSGAASTDYKLIESKGNYYAAWKAIGVDNKSYLKAQSFDSQGTALSAAPLALTAGMNNIGVENVSLLSNGSVAVLWYEQNTSSQFSLKMQCIDSQGKALSAAPVTFTGGMNYAYLANVSLLSNGSIAVLWNEQSTSSKYFLKMQYVDSQGKVSSAAPVTLSGWMNSISVANVSTLSNGNIGIFWYQQDASSKYSAKAQFLDSQGKALSASPVTLTGAMNNAGISKISLLSNGNVAAFWYEQGADSKYSVKVQYLDSQGRALSTAPVTLTTLTGYANISNVSLLSNGNVAVFWNELDANNKYSIKAQYLDSQGRTLSAVPLTIISRAATANISNVSLLSNGSLGVFWYEWDATSKYSLKAQFLDSQGRASSAVPIVLAGGMNSVAISNISLLSDGGMVVFWNAQNSSSKSYLKVQYFDSQGKASSAGVVTLTEGTNSANINNVSLLSNGNVAVFWNEQDANNKYSVKAQYLDSQGRALSAAPVILTAGMNGASMSGAILLSNGGMAILWYEQDATSKPTLKARFLDSQGRALSDASTTLSGGMNFAGTRNISVLSDGNVAVFWCELNSSSKYFLMAQFLDSQGRALSAAPLSLAAGTGFIGMGNVSVLSNGGLAVFWSEAQAGSGAVLRAQAFDSTGTSLSIGSLKPSSSPNTTLTDYGRAIIDSYIYNPLMAYYDMARESGLVNMSNRYPGLNNSGNIFKSLLMNREIALKGLTAGDAGQGALELTVANVLKASALSLPNGQIPTADMDIAMRLANILKNPTEDQKMIIATITSLLADVKKVDDGSNQTLGLEKASDDLLQMVASVLLAQGVPDLLKSGDVSNIKSIFSELDQARAKIMLEYAKSTKPYYENMIKNLAKNMAMLQGKNLLNPNITKDELSKLPPSELDKILEKIKNMKDKTFEEEYLLQQEQKYRKDYLDPSKKKLEGDMKGMLKSFTERLNDVLKTTDKK